jgi:glycosyltransferase involved in cell wall biosynthesis
MTGAPKKRVLYVVHNHPSIRPGGAEGYALDFYEAVRDAGDFEPVLLARTGPPASTASRHHEGTPVTRVNEDPNQSFLHTDLSNWDWIFGRSPNKSVLTRFYRDFLLEVKPAIVHFQHTLWIGYDVLRVTRNTLPDVPIVYTLHEYLPICHRNGQLVRTRTNELCEEESPRRCHECFPDISQQTFFMRKRFIQSHLDLVDLFITASPYALERYVDWGIPREKIKVEPYGHRPLTHTPAPGVDRPGNRFGFFGQFTFFKGAEVLLRAMARLGRDFPGSLFIHGANPDAGLQDAQDEITELLARTKATVTVVGQYEREDLTALMERIDWVVVPSIWWETGPLTVGEAFQHGRPVICSDMGGMSEKVTDEVNGLYFSRGDAGSLAEVMRRAATTDGLWERLAQGIPAVPLMGRHVAELSDHYRALLEQRTAIQKRSEALSNA